MSNLSFFNNLNIDNPQSDISQSECLKNDIINKEVQQMQKKRPINLNLIQLDNTTHSNIYVKQKTYNQSEFNQLLSSQDNQDNLKQFRKQQSIEQKQRDDNLKNKKQIKNIEKIKLKQNKQMETFQQKLINQNITPQQLTKSQQQQKEQQQYLNDQSDIKLDQLLQNTENITNLKQQSEQKLVEFRKQRIDITINKKIQKHKIINRQKDCKLNESFKQNLINEKISPTYLNNSLLEQNIIDKSEVKQDQLNQKHDENQTILNHQTIYEVGVIKQKVDINMNNLLKYQEEIKDVNVSYLDQNQNRVDGLFNNTKINHDIQSKLFKRDYILTEYLDSGGQADVFVGCKNISQTQEFYAFKIYFEATNEDFEKEIKIMKSFEKPIHIVKIIDSFKIQSFFILVLEKCQFSLKYEFSLFKKIQMFSIDELLQIIFDLLDGLIQFRIYNILHLDIKPSNILKSKDGNYCYSDFGTSFNIKNQQVINVEYYTYSFSSPEQINNQNSIDFQSDIYSLGKTFQRSIDIFKEVNKECQKIKNIRKVILNFEQVISEKMILAESIKRLKCQDLHQQFLQILKKKKIDQFLLKYQNSIQKMIDLYEYDQNKDIPYFLQIKLFYNLIKLDLIEYQNYILQINNKKNNYKKQLFKKECKQIWQNYEMKKQIFRVNNPDICLSLNKVGMCYQDLGDIQNGLKYQLESLEMRKQIFQGNHPDIATSLNNVGMCYQKLGNIQNGLKYQLESLEMRKQIFQGNHPDIAASLNNVGMCYQKLGDIQNGLKFQLESLEMSKQIFQGNHPYIATSLNNVGFCYQDLGDIQNGLKYQLESLEMRKQIFQGNHPDIAASLNNVGMCHKDLGDFQNGLKYQLESLEMRKQIFQGNHPDISTSLNNVGTCYRKLGDIQNGLKYQLESLEMIKQIFQGNHPSIAASLNNVGMCYQDLGDFQNGLKYQLESLEMKKQIFQGNHPSIATSLNNVGMCYQDLGDIQNGLKYQLESLEMRKQIFQGNHPDIAASLNNVGMCYQDLGDIQNGQKYQLESLEMRKQIFQGNHPD